MIDSSSQGSNIKQIELFNNYEYFLLDYSWKVNKLKDSNEHVGCFWSLQTEAKKLGKEFGPLRICGPSNALRISPDPKAPLKRDEVLECYDEGATFGEPKIAWIHKLGPLPRPKGLTETQQNFGPVNSSKLNLADLPSSGLYIFTCQVISKCGGKDILSKRDVQLMILSPENTALFTTVNISRPMILIPDRIDVECPNILTGNKGLMGKSLTWFRLHQQVNTVSPETHPSALNLSQHNLINGTVVTRHPNFFAYQHQHENELFFAMNIKPSSLDDFGYYGCTFCAISTIGGTRELIVSQISAVPVCIVLNTTQPTLRLTPFQPGSCYHEGDLISATCEALAYQAFCVEDDKPLGLRLLTTVATLNILSDANETSTKLEVFKSIITGSNPPKKLIYYSPVVLNISLTQNGATISCETRPEINDESYTSSAYFTKLQSTLKRRATARVCVFFPPTNIQINPAPPDKANEKNLVLELRSGQWVTCLASGNPTPNVALDAYPLRKGALTEVISLGLAGISHWSDLSRSQPKWSTATLKNDTGSMMFVKKESDVSKDQIYVGVCRATNEINGKEHSAHKVI